MATFYVPAVNLIGKGVVNEVGPYIKELGYKKALLVTDKYIEGSDILPKTLKPLDTEGIEYVIFSDVEPNPTCKNVTDGVAALQEHGCDFIISLGGGSPQDAASCISIMATNGGRPQDYEGLHKSAKKGLPVVAINTTAGTSAEITINYVITDEERKVKMVMVDKNSLALISVNDPELMLSKPKGLTAATGMDALTHAVEALVTPGAYDVTKKLSIGAIELIKEYLPHVSNQYKNQAEEEGKPLSDKYIFEKILGKTYAAFKKDQINERVEKLGKLKPITINYNGKSEVIDSKEKLQELMNKAVKDEVAQI